MTTDNEPTTHPLIVPPPADLSDVFRATRYRFTSGVRAGETAHIRDAGGNTLLTYRSFASIVGIVAALVAGIVIIAGAASALFLFAEQRPLAAIAALVMSLAFSGLIATLVPRTKVTLYEGTNPALTIAQRSRFSFPAAAYTVYMPDGASIGTLRRSAIARLVRNRWLINAPPDQRGSAFAVERTLGRALVRKLFGKFNRSYEVDYRIVDHGMPAGEIIRRPDANGDFDILQIEPGSALDRRVAVALATLIFGAEP